MENWKKRQKDSRSPRRFARFESVVFRASVLECGSPLCRFRLGTHWRVLGLCVRKSGRRTAAVQDASRDSGAGYFAPAFWSAAVFSAAFTWGLTGGCSAFAYEKAAEGQPHSKTLRAVRER